jgi:hypothetical protein
LMGATSSPAPTNGTTWTTSCSPAAFTAASTGCRDSPRPPGYAKSQ